MIRYGTDGILYISPRNGDVGSIKRNGCVCLCHVSAFIIKCVSLFLYLVPRLWIFKRSSIYSFCILYMLASAQYLLKAWSLLWYYRCVSCKLGFYSFTQYYTVIIIVNLWDPTECIHSYCIFPYFKILTYLLHEASRLQYLSTLQTVNRHLPSNSIQFRAI